MAEYRESLGRLEQVCRRGKRWVPLTFLGVLGCLLGWVTPAMAITRTEVLARAQAWVDDAVPYSFDAWYTDPTSGICCYRTDCSGYVSAVWGLPAPGHTTYSFAGGVWDDGVSYVINASQLLPGDALNYPGDPSEGTGHIMLYVSGDFWSGWVEVYEEYSHGHTATHRWRSIDPNLYLPIRYKGIEDCSTEICDGKDNDCDGQVDEIASTEVCDGKDNDCDGQTDEDWICETAEEPALSAWRFDQAATSDLDGDGKADVCARGTAGLYCYLSTGRGFTWVSTLSALSDAAGFDEEDNYSTIRLADVNGDGRADVCARHDTDGFRCWPFTGSGFGTVIQGPALSDAQGWADPANYTTLRMADVNNDGRGDLCARADAGLLCWLSNGQKITQEIKGPALSDAQGWSDVMYYSTLRMGDINGDKLVDICARSKDGVSCWLFNGQAFATQVTGPPMSNKDGWGNPQYYLTMDMPDINGDGRADICARASAGIRCWTSTGTGFGSAIVGPSLSNELGWSAYPYYSSLRWADVTGDGLDDVCARGVYGEFCYPSTGTGFRDHNVGPAWTNALGWLDPSNYRTIQTGDLNEDGAADVCARSDAGLECWLSDGTDFPTWVDGPDWSDALGWSAEKFYNTFRLSGGELEEVSCVPSKEVCDGVDNDCDGAIDEDLDVTYYLDADADGYGDIEMPRMACLAPDGFVLNGLDCDDGSDEVFPGAAETCDGLDNDCDGQLDESVQQTFYADADGDAFGNASSGSLGCEVPPGYVTSGTDCNDEDAGVNPAAEERCNGVDDNCNSSVDEPFADSNANGVADCLEDADQDGFPRSQDCDDGQGNVYPGATEQCGNGVDEDCDHQDLVCDPTPTAIPGDDDTTDPGDDDTTSAGDDDTIPGDDDTTVPGDDDTIPGDDDTTAPGDDDTQPGDDDATTAGDDDTIPGDDDATVPGDDDTVAGDDDTTAPGDDDTQPGDDDGTTAVEQTASPTPGDATPGCSCDTSSSPASRGPTSALSLMLLAVLWVQRGAQRTVSRGRLR